MLFRSDELVQIGYGSYLLNAAADCAGCHSSAAGFLSGGTRFARGRRGWHSRRLDHIPSTTMANPSVPARRNFLAST